MRYQLWSTDKKRLLYECSICIEGHNDNDYKIYLNGHWDVADLLFITYNKEYDDEFLSIIYKLDNLYLTYDFDIQYSKEPKLQLRDRIAKEVKEMMKHICEKYKMFIFGEL